MSALKLFVGENIQGIELQQIGNMGEVHMSLDTLFNFTIDKNGTENIKNIKEKLYLRVISQKELQVLQISKVGWQQRYLVNDFKKPGKK